MSDNVKNTIQELKPRLKDYLVSIGTKFTANNMMHCPFTTDHNREDKNASAIISDRNNNIFHCFGCGRRGDIISVCMELENIGFAEAIHRLCELFGIQEGNIVKAETRSGILEDISKYISRRGGTTLATKRGIPINVCRGYSIGTISTKKAEELSSKYSADDKLKTGMWKQESDGSLSMLPLLGVNIISFAIKNEYGRTIGITGRRPKGYTPKYMETKLNKYGNKEVPYLIDKALTTIRSSGTAILVEGYIDAIQMHIAGYKETIAVRCAAPMKKQIDTLNALDVKGIILMLDNDETGKKNTYKILSNHYTRNDWPNMKIKVAVYDDKYKDPDEMISKVGKDMVSANVEVKHGFMYMLENTPPDFSSGCEVIYKFMDIAASDAENDIDINIYATAIQKILGGDLTTIERGIYSKWIKRL